MDDINIKAKAISILIDELIETSEALNQLERSLLIRLNNDEPEAHRIFNEGIFKSEQIFKRIGQKINELGGLEVMQYAFYQVPGADSLISNSWNGIGEWHD